MQEIIFVGTGDAVLAERRRSIEVFSAALDELGVAYEIRSATDPFFVNDFANQATFQHAFELKFEVRALPALQEEDLRGRVVQLPPGFLRARVRHPPATMDSRCTTGCTGFGLGRAALMILAQFGLDPKDWPPQLLEGFDARDRRGGIPSARVPSTDVARLEPLWTRLYDLQRAQGMQMALPPDAFAQWAASLKPVLERFAIVILAEASGEPAGFLAPRAYAARPHGLEATPSASRARCLWVRPAHRGRGVGERLVRAAEEWFRAQGIERAELQVADGQRGRESPLCEARLARPSSFRDGAGTGLTGRRRGGSPRQYGRAK